MRNYLLAAVAAAALTSPAMARDKSTYVGVDGGVMLVEDTHLRLNRGIVNVGDALTIDHKTGFDVDLVAGYDFGLVRAEAEFGYKRAGVNFVQSDGAFIGSSDWYYCHRGPHAWRIPLCDAGCRANDCVGSSSPSWWRSDGSAWRLPLHFP